MNKQELLNKYNTAIPVGHDGFVSLVDVMGDDADICNAARISYGKGTTQKRDDEKLIRYLIKNYHTSPLEMAEIKFHIRLPMDIMRQLVRHRTANLNEYSTRYSEAIDSYADVMPGEWRMQSTSNKQGSSGLFIESDRKHSDAVLIAKDLSTLRRSSASAARNAYNKALNYGIAREQARSILPLATYTEIVWKIDLNNLFKFLRLRLDHHAQQEIREFAEAIATIVKDWVPAAWSGFEDYQLNACSFSKQEMDWIRQALKQTVEQLEADSDLRIRSFESVGLENKRDRIEFFQKLKG